MVKAIKLALLALLFVASEASAQFCPGLPPWVFDDVPSTHPFCTDITWMAQRGVTLGCTLIDPNHRLYCPDSEVTRAEMAAFMHRLGNVTFQQGGNVFGAAALLGTTDTRPLELIVKGQRALHLQYVDHSNPILATINITGGHPNNRVARTCTGILCSIGNTEPVRGGTIAGGGNGSSSGDNRVTDSYGFVGGGSANLAGNDNSDASDATYAAVAGGVANTASGEYSFVGGGLGNVASGKAATIPGGAGNSALGIYAFAAGYNAHANAHGCFVWADFSSNDFTCNTANLFMVRASGGFELRTDAFASTGCFIVSGGGSWSCTSSRDVKEGITNVDPLAILDRVVAMPISTWRYRTETSGALHLGPMSEDFREAFGLGTSSKEIGMIDAQGVALAAIQGLNAKLEGRNKVIDAQGRELAEQRAEINELRRAVEALRARTASEATLAQTR